MSIKIRPEDWDYLFAPDAPRRGGPLRALVHVLVTLLVLGLLGGGASYALRLTEERAAANRAAATALAATVYPIRTATALALAQATAQAAAAPTPTPTVPILGVGTVQNGGNLRSEPRVAPETVQGQIWPGDQIEFLEESLVGGQSWFRIRVTAPATNRGGPGVEAGTVGWAAGSLLSAPQ
ncbi:MAG TPA: SH3 domain-containing protein [Roseiflexaceae bacterium]|nr:SH3 domain-containing protein [Roseiflexaceae bacterium]